MNYYEHTYIASQSLNNKDLSDLHQKIEDLIKKNKGKKIERIDANILRFMTIKIKNVPEENSELVLKEDNK